MNTEIGKSATEVGRMRFLVQSAEPRFKKKVMILLVKAIHDID